MKYLKRFVSHVAIALILASTGTAYADDISSGEALTGYRNKNRDVFIYVQGLGDGLRSIWALSQVMQRDLPFCVPPGTILTDNKLMDILASYLGTMPDMKKQAAASTLTFAVIQALPCERRR